MLRGDNSSFGRRGLDDAPDIHHGDPFADVLDHAQVVRDEEIREPEPVLQFEQEVEDLGLDRHVQRRHGLVGDDQAGDSGQGTGDADALALPAR